MNYFFRRALVLVLFLLSLQGVGVGKAYADELVWCYNGDCTFTSRPAAEARMNAVNPGYSFDVVDMGAYGTGMNTLHRVNLQYTPRDVAPTQIFSSVYVPDNTSNPAPEYCVASNDPVYPNSCKKESDLVDGIVASYARIYGAARVKYSLVNNYFGDASPAAPFSEVVTLGVTAQGIPRGIFRHNYDYDYSRQRKLVITILDEFGNPMSGGAELKLFKFTSLLCPVGYSLRNGTHPLYNPNATNKTTAPSCSPNIAVQTITSPGLQVCTKAGSNHPCYPATGDKARFETDFEFSGRPFVRSYHSLRQTGQKPAFAPGWTHSYSDRVMGTIGADAVEVISDNGYYEVFIRSGYSLRYISPGDATRVVDVVTENNRNLFKLSGIGDIVKYFNDAGRLLRVENVSTGWKVSMSYDDSGRLVSVADQAGQTLQLNYQGDVLTSLQLPGGQFVQYTYDADHNFQSVVYADGTTRSYSYNEAGYSDANDPHALTGISDNGVRYATFGYDNRGRVRLSQLHANGAITEKTTLAYAGDTSVTMTGDRGQITTYALSSESKYRRIVGTTTALGTTTNSYNGGKVSEERDPAGNITRYEYTPDGVFVNARYDAYGTSVERVTRITRNAGYLVTAEDVQQKSGTGYVTKQRKEWTYDVDGSVRAVTTIDPATGASRTITYDRCTYAITAPTGPCPIMRLITAIDGPRTDVLDKTTFGYYNWDDPACIGSPTGCNFLVGKLKRITNALGQTIEFLGTDRNFGRPTRVRDANGVITDFEYNSRGWMTARKVRGTDDATEADDQIVRMEYEPSGDVSKITLPDGSYTTYTYDSAHRLTGLADADGNRMALALDSGGAPMQQQITDAQGALMYSVSRSYTVLGEVQSVTDAYNRTTAYSTDANGNLDQSTDPLGRVSDNNVDPLNRLTRTLQDMNGIAAETKFSYDTLDNVTQVNDPKGLNTNYSYNGLGDLVQLQSPDTGTTTYTYDSAGNRISQTDARGVTTTYSYDALNRVIAVGTPTPSLNVTFVYDGTQTCATGESFNIGRLTRIVDGSGSTTFCYDRFGHLVRKSQTTNGKTFVLRYQYNVAGQLTGIVYPDGAAVDYGYDNHGHAVSVGVTPAGGTRQVVLSSASYYPFGPVAQWAYGNGRVMKRGYNRNYQPGFVEVTGTGGLSLGYEFDAAGNLIKLRRADQADPPQRGYAYDGLNRLIETKNAGTGAVLEAYGYDKTGNRTSATTGGTTTAYGIATTSHRLASVGAENRSYDAAGNTLQIGAGKSFTYDALGRMNQVTAAGGVVRNYAYNGAGEQVRRWGSAAGDDRYSIYAGSQWLGDYDSNGAPVQQVVWFGTLPVAVLNGSGASQKLYYIEPDALGTPRQVVDPVRGASGTVVWAWDLAGEAFGNTAPNQDPDGDSTVFVFDMRFPGQRYDAVSGMNYNYFRDYESATGRYVESDPIGLFGGVSTYGYVGGEPMVHLDLFGLARKTIDLGGGFTGGVDTFNVGGSASFEIHVYDRKGNEIGVYGPNGWINKHGFKDAPTNIPAKVAQECELAAEDLRVRIGLPRKLTLNGVGNGSGGWLRSFFAEWPYIGSLIEDTKPSPQKTCDSKMAEAAGLTEELMCN